MSVKQQAEEVCSLLIVPQDFDFSLNVFERNICKQDAWVITAYLGSPGILMKEA